MDTRYGISDQNDNYSLKNSLKNQKNFTNKHINKLEKFKSGKNFYEQKNSISALKYCDIRLQVLYSYLKRKNFDDYTIVLMGDHGTTFDESKRTNVLTKNHQNVGFFIKDKKNKFTKKKNKLIETIDIFPRGLEILKIKQNYLSTDLSQVKLTDVFGLISNFSFYYAHHMSYLLDIKMYFEFFL